MASSPRPVANARAPRPSRPVAKLAADHAPLRRFALIQGACSDVATLEALVRDIPTQFPLIVTDIGPVVGTHGGPGIIGLTWIQE